MIIRKTIWEDMEQLEKIYSDAFESQLLRLTKNTSMAELDYEHMFRHLPQINKRSLWKKGVFYGKGGNTNID